MDACDYPYKQKKLAMDLNKEINKEGSMILPYTLDELSLLVNDFTGLLPVRKNGTFGELPKPCLIDNKPALAYSELPGSPNNLEQLLNQAGIEFFTRSHLGIESPTTSNYLHALNGNTPLLSHSLGLSQIVRYGSADRTVENIIDHGGIWNIHDKEHIPFSSLLMALSNCNRQLKFKIFHSFVWKLDDESPNSIISARTYDVINSYAKPTQADIRLLSELQEKNIIHRSRKMSGKDSLQVHYQLGKLPLSDIYDVSATELLLKLGLYELGYVCCSNLNLQNTVIKQYRHIELFGELKEKRLIN